MSAEPATRGVCDTPQCTETADEITPEGYVCSRCAREIERKYRKAERLEERVDR